MLCNIYWNFTASPTAAADKVYTEADWADPESAEPLVKSLILAEKSAWDFVKELPGMFEVLSLKLCVGQLLVKCRVISCDDLVSFKRL